MALSLLGSATATALADDSGWSIGSFLSDVKVDSSGGLTVAETIDVDFAQPRHGIERQFGLQEGPGGSDIQIGSLTATDAGGTTLKVDEQTQWPVVTFRIGDPGQTLTGHQTYHLSYTVQGMVGSLASGQERVDWPVTGTRWPVAMGSVKATFEAPAGALADASCEAGPKGSESACPAQHDASSATFQSPSALPAGQGLRAVATLVAGAVPASSPAPTSDPQTQSPAQDTNDSGLWLPLLGGGVIVASLLFSLFAWARRGWRRTTGSSASYYDSSTSSWTDSGSSSSSGDSGSSGGGDSGGGGGGGGDSGGGSW